MAIGSHDGRRRLENKVAQRTREMKHVSDHSEATNNFWRLAFSSFDRSLKTPATGKNRDLAKETTPIYSKYKVCIAKVI